MRKERNIIFSMILLLLLPVFSDQLKLTTDLTANDKPKHPGEAIRFRMMQRADENGFIPMDGLVKAKAKIESMQTDDAGLWNWEWLGPGNIGGRIRAILIHPTSTSTIWIGGVAGGIFKSTNGGSSWSVVDDFMANLAITSIVMDPNNHSIMYASTGEGFGNADGLPGAGIFKSTNGGVTWAQLESTNNTIFRWVNRLEHHPDSSGVLYAAITAPHSVWKTNDGGNTWNSVLSTSTRATDVKINPNVPNRVLVGCLNDCYISNDYGVSWTELTTGAANKLPSDPGRCEVTFCPSTYAKCYISMDRNDTGGSDKGEIWWSTDSGVTWSRRSETHYLKRQGWYDNTIWVDPTNSNRIIVGGIDLWRSTDAGASLTKISDWPDYHNGGSANSAHADHHIIVNHPSYNGTTNKKVYFGNDGGIQMTNDVNTVSQNSGWVNLAGTTLGITQFYGGAATPSGNLIVGGTQDNDKVHYTPAGGTGGWTQPHSGDGGFAAINWVNPLYVYGEYVYLSIRRSTNGGSSYVEKVSGLGDANISTRALFIAPFVMDPSDYTRLIAGGSRIWETTDNAANWSEIKTNVGSYFSGGSLYYYRCSAIDVAKSNSNVIWVGYQHGRVGKTTNGGTNWYRVDENGVGLPDRYATDIAINPTNYNQVFVTFSGFNGDNVWYTSDGGTTWTEKTGTAPDDLPDLQVNTVRFHPQNSNWVYIGTDLGVFSSENKGTDWSLMMHFPDNDGPVNTEVSELFWQGDNYLIAATHGRGMFRARVMVHIYVDGDASSGGDGTQANPFQTIREAFDIAGHGSTIHIESGTYDEAPPSLYATQDLGVIIVTNGSVTIK